MIFLIYLFLLSPVHAVWDGTLSMMKMTANLLILRLGSCVQPKNQNSSIVFALVCFKQSVAHLPFLCITQLYLHRLSKSGIVLRTSSYLIISKFNVSQCVSWQLCAGWSSSKTVLSAVSFNIIPDRDWNCSCPRVLCCNFSGVRLCMDWFATCN